MLNKSVKLAERQAAVETAQEIKPEGRSGIDWLGIQYQDLSDSLRQAHGLPDDVNGIIVTSVAPTSPLYEQFVRAGSIVTEVNGQPVKGVADFERIVKSAKKGSYLRLYTLQFDQAGRRQPFFAVVQAP